MDAKINKQCYWIFYFLTLLCAIPLGVLGATDDDIDAIFMTVALNAGQSESVMLSNASEYNGPMFRPAEKTLSINGTSYNTEDVKEIRFEVRQVDAIQDVNQSNEHFADGIIYNLNGQMVGKMDVERLPKGVYIVNGKKIIVR